MSFKYEGREYIVQTPTENAYDLLNYINEKMIELDVRDKNGVVVQFSISLASPIWLIIFGVGFMATVIQKIMYAVGQSFSIADCSEPQVLNLAQIAGLKRGQGGYSTVTLVVTASAEGDCVITPNNTVTIMYEGEDYVFSPVTTTTIKASNTARIRCVADKIGSVYSESGSVTEFDDVVENLDSVTNLAVEPGTNIESINALRSRILSNERISPIDTVVRALNAEIGINKANIYYNTNNISSANIAGHTVAPRSSIIFIQGASDNIAKVYYKYMFSPTTNDDNMAETQSYTAENGQTFSVSYYPAEGKNIYIKLIIERSLPSETMDLIRQSIAKLSNSLAMGSLYNQAYVLQQLYTDIPDLYKYIGGISLSADGATWSSEVELQPNQIGIIPNDEDHIVFEVHSHE